MRSCLEEAESGLNQQPWLAGSQISLADMQWLRSSIVSATCPDFMAADEYPNLKAWCDRLRDVPFSARRLISPMIRAPRSCLTCRSLSSRP